MNTQDATTNEIDILIQSIIDDHDIPVSVAGHLIHCGEAIEGHNQCLQRFTISDDDVLLLVNCGIQLEKNKLKMRRDALNE